LLPRRIAGFPDKTRGYQAKKKLRSIGSQIKEATSLSLFPLTNASDFTYNPVEALALLVRTRACLNRNLYALVGSRLNLIAYLSGADKRESFRMGSSSDAEPMREG
jgi:hypothetical protein